MPMNHDDNEVSFEIVEKIGVLSTYSTGWTKEINLVRWNHGPARYDIREWDPRHTRMSKGQTFDEKEMRILLDSMKKRRRYTAPPAEEPDLEMEDASFDNENIDADGVIQSAEPENDPDENSDEASN